MGAIKQRAEADKPKATTTRRQERRRKGDKTKQKTKTANARSDKHEGAKGRKPKAQTTSEGERKKGARKRRFPLSGRQRKAPAKRLGAFQPISVVPVRRRSAQAPRMRAKRSTAPTLDGRQKDGGEGGFEKGETRAGRPSRNIQGWEKATKKFKMILFADMCFSHISIHSNKFPNHQMIQ